MSLISYHNNPKLKAKKIAHMQAHIDADELIRGSGWDGSRGCAVGCTFDDYDHSKFPVLLGIPEWAGRLLDHLHENTSPNYRHQGGPVALAFLKAIKPGSNLANTEHHIHIFIQQMNLEGVRALAIDDLLKQQILGAISGVIDVRQKALALGWSKSAESAVRSAESAAWSAESAAWSAVRSAAWSAVRSAESAVRSAESAVRSAKSAAWSAESAAWSAESAESAANDKIADEFLRLLGDAK